MESAILYLLLNFYALETIAQAKAGTCYQYSLGFFGYSPKHAFTKGFVSFINLFFETCSATGSKIVFDSVIIYPKRGNKHTNQKH